MTGPFMLRVAGLPAASVRELRCPGSRRWADETVTAADAVRAGGEAVGDLLHPLIGGSEDDAVRRRLLALRREVFNGRLPRDADAALALVRGLDPAAGRALAAWLDARGELEQRGREGARVLAEETARSRAALHRLAGEERLRRALLLASPALDAQLDAQVRRWAADPAAVPDKKGRKIERSLLAYLYRTVCKTSPFSTFTGVAVGGLTDDGPASAGAAFAGSAGGTGSAGSTGATGPAGAVSTGATSATGATGGAVTADAVSSGTTGTTGATGPAPAGRPGTSADSGTPSGLELRVDDVWTGHARLNVAALGRLADTVVADPGRRADLPVALASGWGRDDDRVRYVRRWVTAGDEDTAVTFDAVQDRLFFLRRSGTLERLLGLFEERGSLRYGELAGWLAVEHGAGAGDVERYLEALLDVGMVQVPCLRTQVHDTDPLRAFQDSLRAVGRPWADTLASRLDGPVSHVDRFARAAPADRPAVLAALRTELREIQEELGAGQGRVPQTVLYEDAAAGYTGTPDREVWDRIAHRPLAAVERVLPAFDLTLPQRLVLKGFFLARHGRGGRCDDVLKLVHDFHEDFFDQYMSFTAQRTAFDADGRYVPEVNWLGLPELKALDTARLTFTERMRSLWESRPGDAPEIVVDEAFLTAVADELAPVAPHFAPMSHHVQLADRPGDPLVVLNRSYGGLSFPFSRFTHCFDGLDDRLRDASAALCPPGAVFAEVTGGPVTSNLNLHGRLTGHEIVCPGEQGTLAEEFRIGLDDLYIEHDETADRLVLRSERLGREVVPVYLGYLVPLALPELARTLLLLSPTSMAPLNVWGGVPESDPVDGVTTRPRVRHGALVLSRRSWSAPAAALPLQAPGGAQDAEWFLGWHRFRRAHGLPDRVFATVSDSGARGATGAKPQYVDFDSPLSLSALEALVRSPEARVVLREALPDEDDLHVTSARGRHVAELAVETTPQAPATAPAAEPRGEHVR
ncbi:lantibiotic dehydratase [Streptomyces zhihengii]